MLATVRCEMHSVLSTREFCFRGTDTTRTDTLEEFPKPTREVVDAGLLTPPRLRGMLKLVPTWLGVTRPASSSQKTLNLPQNASRFFQKVRRGRCTGFRNNSKGSGRRSSLRVSSDDSPNRDTYFV